MVRFYFVYFVEHAWAQCDLVQSGEAYVSSSLPALSVCGMKLMRY